MANLGYNEIRKTCRLVDYNFKLAGKHGLWIEVYRDKTHEYLALFSEHAEYNLPITIIKHEPI